MALLEWRDEFCTGIEGVDHEHEQLIEQINSVYDMIRGRADREDVVDGLGEIYGSISAHFALEESMMIRHNYADYDQHQTDHERLLDEIREITDEFEATEQLDDARLARRLTDWFQLHFKTHDSRLHKMAAMREHLEVNRATLKSLIQDAKDRFINRA